MPLGAPLGNPIAIEIAREEPTPNKPTPRRLIKPLSAWL